MLKCQFNHIHIISSDLGATERWFVEGVGAELIDRRDAGGVLLSEVRLGGAQILIRGARDNETYLPPSPRHFGTDHFGIQVSDIDAAVAELRGRGVTIEVEPFNFRPYLRIAFIKGPDNVRIELVQPQ